MSVALNQSPASNTEAGATKPASAPAVEQRPATVASLVRATGRTRKAGYGIGGGGIAMVVSTFTPWVSLDGVDSTNPKGSGLFFLIGVGGLLAYLGSQILQDRVTKTTRVTLWVAAAVDILLVLGVFSGLASANSQAGAMGSVQPAPGFFIGVGGLLASLAGTVLVQTVRRRATGADSTVDGQ